MGEAKRRKHLDSTWGKLKSSNYLNEFQAALARTEKFGLSTPKVSYTHRRLLSKRVQHGTERTISQRFGPLSLEQIAHQCLHFNFRLEQPLSECLNQPVIFTIGHIYIFESQECLYSKTEDQLKAMLEKGVDRPSVDLHAWLTLPSMEIIDSVFFTSYYAVKKLGEPFRILISHPEELIGMSYHPMLIGTDFLRKTGLLVEL